MLNARPFSREDRGSKGGREQRRKGTRENNFNYVVARDLIYVASLRRCARNQGVSKIYEFKISDTVCMLLWAGHSPE